MDPPTAPRWRRFRTPAIGVAVALVAVLYRFDPGRSGFYPRCAFHSLTGLHCPGCGATRALHHLLHGRLGLALSYNALIVATLAYLGYSGLASAAERRGRGTWPRLFRSAWAVLALAGVLLAFAVLRNLPWEPFRRLAPGAWWG